MHHSEPINAPTDTSKDKLSTFLTSSACCCTTTQPARHQIFTALQSYNFSGIVSSRGFRPHLKEIGEVWGGGGRHGLHEDAGGKGGIAAVGGRVVAQLAQ